MLTTFVCRRALIASAALLGCLATNGSATAGDSIPAASAAPSTAPHPIDDIPAHIEKMLGKKLEVAYLKTQLGDVVNDLELRTKINIELDVAALTADGLGTETIITFAAKEVSLASILNQMLGRERLAWWIDDEVLMISTASAAAFHLSTKFYPLDFLAAADGSIDYDELSEMLMQSVDRASWRPVGGGPGSISRFTAKKLFVVAQTNANHRTIASIFRQLGSAGKEADAGVRIESELQMRGDVQYLCTQLGDMVNDLEQRHRIPVYLDIPALTADGKGVETIINKTLKDAKLSSVLDLILLEQGLAWTITDEGLLITTQTNEPSIPSTIVYSVADLANSAGTIAYDEIISIIKQSVDPESWGDAFIDSRFAISKVGVKKSLVITQTYQNHRMIKTLLKRLADAAQPGAAK